MPEPRILLWDIECAPSLGYFYDRYKEGNIIEVVQEGFLLSFAYKWLDQKSVHVRSLPDFPSYKTNPKCDKALCEELHSLLGKADLTVAHNGDRFDLRFTHARMLANGLPPYRRSKSADTLKIARKEFKFGSNRLDDLGNYLGVGRKLFTLGRDTILGAMAGDKTAWADFKKYNAQDVLLLQAVYEKLRPYSTTHPNLSFFTQSGCPVCQSKKTKADGFHYLRTGKRQRHECLACGHRYSSGRIIKP